MNRKFDDRTGGVGVAARDLASLLLVSQKWVKDKIDGNFKGVCEN